MLGALDRLSGDVRLVLDDVHELTDPAVLEELRTLIRYRPTHLRVVLSSRTAPPLSLARLRLQGDLTDILGDALCFTPEETAVFVDRSGLAARGDEVERLHRLTGGWAAGLRLVADAAATQSTGLAGVLGTLAGEDGPAAGHLAHAMLAHLPDTDRSFLDAIGVVDPVPPALAVELSGLDGAALVLARLADLGLVTDGPVPGHHSLLPLLRRHLRADLARRDPARATRLHGRAARWFAGADRPARALEHARRAGDPHLLADLLRDWAVPLVLAGHQGDLRAGLRRLRPPTVAQDARLRAAAALLDPARSPGQTGRTTRTARPGCSARSATGCVRRHPQEPTGPGGRGPRPSRRWTRRPRARTCSWETIRPRRGPSWKGRWRPPVNGAGPGWRCGVPRCWPPPISGPRTPPP